MKMYQLVIIDWEGKMFLVGGEDIDMLRHADIYIRGRPEMQGVFRGSWIINSETEEILFTFGKSLEGKTPRDFGYIRGANPHAKVSREVFKTGEDNEGVV